MNPPSPIAIRFKYTFKFFVGVCLSLVIIYVGYLIVTNVENIFVRGLVILFIGFPAVAVALKLPLEIMILVGVWTAKDPALFVSGIDDLRISGKL